MCRFVISVQENALLVCNAENKEKWISLSNESETLKVDRVEKNAHFKEDIVCDGVLGVYSLSKDLFVAIIKSSKKIGDSVNGDPIYQIQKVELVKIPSQNEEYANMKYCSMIEEVMKTANLYYSHHMDLTKRLQSSLCEPLSDEDRLLPTTMNPEFMFNAPIIAPFAPFKSLLLRDLIPIVIFGFMSIIPSITIRKLSFSLTLISRRSIHRNGRRFNTRGADVHGHVANFVESEQIVKESSGKVYSFVQIRGSIPLEWSQSPYMKYTPKIRIFGEASGVSEPFGRHFDALVREYGRVTVVNLIDKKKNQLMIGEAFERGCENYNKAQNSVDFFWFDFHAECKKMHYENLEKLMDQTRACVARGEFFAYDLSRKEIQRLQTAVLRTNCIDCLDRTNVVQSLYAKHMLFSQLFGDDGEAVLAECFDGPVKHEIFTVFNGLWSDNADQMSLLYSSSRSLKTDFTRTGKRTTRGAIDDGVNSVIRYFNNNFCDGYFEDCLNLAFARVEMGEAADRRVVKEKKCTFGSFLCVVMLPLSAVCYGLSCCVPDDYASSAFWTLLTLSTAAVGYLFVKKGTSFGRTFVSRAMLPLKE
ncbi:hypothetical protein WA577_000729 [Blastocystis sp. JDR]